MRRHPEQVNITIPSAKLWSTTSPHLYDLSIKMGADTVTAYFGLRTYRLGDGPKGKRPLLNGKFTFAAGFLDQVTTPPANTHTHTHTPPGVSPSCRLSLPSHSSRIFIAQPSASSSSCVLLVCSPQRRGCFVYSPLNMFHGDHYPRTVCACVCAVTVLVCVRACVRACVLVCVLVLSWDVGASTTVCVLVCVLVCAFVCVCAVTVLACALQSWWPDGQYTAPTDEGLAYDVEAVHRPTPRQISPRVYVCVVERE